MELACPSVDDGRGGLLPCRWEMSLEELESSAINGAGWQPFVVEFARKFCFKVGLENATGMGLRPLCRLKVAWSMDSLMQTTLQKYGARKQMNVADMSGDW